MLEFQAEEFGLYSEGSEERRESLEQQKSRTGCGCQKEPLGKVVNRRLTLWDRGEEGGRRAEQGLWGWRGMDPKTTEDIEGTVLSGRAFICSVNNSPGLLCARPCAWQCWGLEMLQTLPCPLGLPVWWEDSVGHEWGGRGYWWCQGLQQPLS